jgi:hypothetical protein
VSVEDVIGDFSVGWSEQERFARLSGDWNPIHVDADFARRSSFGEPVVHGMSTLLSALECFCKSLGKDDQSGLLGQLPEAVTVQFPRPVFVGDNLRLVRVSQDDKRLRLAVRSGDVDLARITVGLPKLPGVASAETQKSVAADVATSCRLPDQARHVPARRSPAQRSMADGEGLVLTRPFSVDAAVMSDIYPSLINWIGESRVAAIALLSSVVGMEWPGARSLFTEAKIKIVDVEKPFVGVLTTQVLTADAKHGLTMAETKGGGIIAATSAFFRPHAVMQPTLKALQSQVEPDAFKGWTALVVGGSRGLGEVAAKLMAAGSADVVVTYRSGRAQAEAVKAEIVAFGGRCEIAGFDAGKSGLNLPVLDKPDAPVLLFYSASPHIFRRRTQDYSRAWFEEFLSIYVDGFIDVLQTVKAWTSGQISVLYPSTEAVDQPMAQLVEYAAAKAAGEAACRSITAGDARIRVDLPRLPRLLTDQTNSIIHVDTAEPAAVLLPVLRRLTSRV